MNIFVIVSLLGYGVRGIDIDTSGIPLHGYMMVLCMISLYGYMLNMCMIGLYGYMMILYMIGLYGYMIGMYDRRLSGINSCCRGWSETGKSRKGLGCLFR